MTMGDQAHRPSVKAINGWGLVWVIRKVKGCLGHRHLMVLWFTFMKCTLWYKGRAAELKSQEPEAGMLSLLCALLTGKVDSTSLGLAGGGFWLVVESY